MGAMGGLNPPSRSLSQAVFPPPKRGYQENSRRTIPLGAWFLGQLHPFGCHGSHGQPLWGGVSRSNPPQMAPLISGLLGFAGEYSWSLCYRFLQICIDFLGRLFLVNSRSCIHMTISLYDHCFFSRNRPLEESPHRSCRAFRGEVDSSIPRV